MSGLLSKVKDFFTGNVNKNVIQAGTYDPYYSGLYGANTLSDVHISSSNAETIGPFFTCLRVKAETMASIHTHVREVDGDNYKRAKSHPVDYLLSTKPNKNYNAWSFWFTTEYLENVWGNSFAEIKRDRGAASSIHMLLPWKMQVKVLDGSIIYDYDGRIIPARNILHFKQNSLDGVIGRPISAILREQLGLAKKQENYAAKSVGSKPPSVFEGGEGFKEDTSQRIAEAFQEHVKKGIPPVLWNGLKYKNVMMPAGDLQLFEMKGVTTADIYAAFRMPQSKGGNYSREAGATYNNVEQQNINFVQDVVIPSITQKENECNIKLFTRKEFETFEVHFDLSELIKADLKTLAEVYDKGWSKGVISKNEMRNKVFGLNPVDGGDRFYVQAGFIPEDKIDSFYDNKGDSELKELLKEFRHEEN